MNKSENQARGSEFTIKPSVREWLLEENNPSVRYYTLRDLLDRPPAEGQVAKARDDIMESRVVAAILFRQKGGGYWEAPERFYTAKYRGTVWQLIILAELGASGSDTRIKKACEFILANSQDRESGGFSTNSSKSGGGLKSRVVPCLTGNMVWSLIRLGYLDDPRVLHGIDWITAYQRFDDGIRQPPQGWPYDPWKICWGKHTCHMGVVKALKALAEIPEAKRTRAVKSTIEQGAEFMLRHHIFKRSHNLKRLSKPEWRRFGFPLMYQTDALEILGILASLGYHDERMREAVDLVNSKKDPKGRWKLESSFNGRFQISIEREGRASKWITLNALRALKRFQT